MPKKSKCPENPERPKKNAHKFERDTDGDVACRYCGKSKDYLASQKTESVQRYEIIAEDMMLMLETGEPEVRFSKPSMSNKRKQISVRAGHAIYGAEVTIREETPGSKVYFLLAPDPATQGTQRHGSTIVVERGLSLKDAKPKAAKLAIELEGKRHKYGPEHGDV